MVCPSEPKSSEPDHRHSEIERLLLGVKPRVERELRRYRIPLADSEDILQQTFLALVYQWQRVRNPEAWLLGTVRNQCRLYWKKRRGAVYRSVDLAVLDDLARSHPPRPHQHDLWVDIESGLAQLDERCQRLLRLRYQLGMSSSEIADCLGYSPSSVSNLSRRCLRCLADRLSTSPGESGPDTVRRR